MDRQDGENWLFWICNLVFFWKAKCIWMLSTSFRQLSGRKWNHSNLKELWGPYKHYCFSIINKYLTECFLFKIVQRKKGWLKLCITFIIKECFQNFQNKWVKSSVISLRYMRQWNSPISKREAERFSKMYVENSTLTYTVQFSNLLHTDGTSPLSSMVNPKSCTGHF